MTLLPLLLACAEAPDPAEGGEESASFADPAARGPHAAGTFEAAATSTAGLESLPVQVWFPAAETTGDPYEYDDVFAGTAYEGTPDCSEPRPVVVFSHGNGGMRYQSWFLAEHLASHGYVVVSPDHVGNTFFDVDGDSVPLAELIFRRPQDVKDSYEWLLGAPELAGCVEESAGYAMIGHSFGGYTTTVISGAVLDADAIAAQCAQRDDWLCDDIAAWLAEHPGEIADLSDPRAWAGVPMTPAGYELLVGGLDDVTVPMMVLGGSRDDLTPMSSQVRPIYEGLGGWRALGELTDAGHYTFSNACDMLATFEDCAPPYLDPAQAHPLISELVTAFLALQRGYAEAEAHLPPADAAVVWEQHSE